jgi:ubiquinone/menaquinone biosynthesis C-methylase UbiE
MIAAEIYDQIGKGYAAQRKPEQRWQDLINAELTGSTTLLNVGAGSGSYEPSSVNVIALEPSPTMIKQRSASAAPVVCGIAERLPFADRAFDVAMAILTVHHWSDPGQGLAEMRRVSRKQIIVTWDSAVFAEEFWLIRDYLPEVAKHEANLPTLSAISGHLHNP